MSRSYLFTSESVSDGHPDKLADRISDAILDRCLEIEPMARVAIETLIAPHLVVVAGEIAFPTALRHGQVLEEIPGIARNVLLDTGYTQFFPGIDPDECEILVRVNHQSPQIARAVERADDEYGDGAWGVREACAKRWPSDAVRASAGTAGVGVRGAGEARAGPLEAARVRNEPAPSRRRV